ncbi:MAG: PDZ domain-containing protein [Pseudohongiellaceae bacterium]
MSSIDKTQFSQTRDQARTLIVALFCSVLLAGCISYEPAQLVPSLSFSPEDISLLNPGGTASGVDFGFVVGINESDSLSNLTVLPGVRVRSVTPGGAAAAAGILPGDVILSINGLETDNPDTVQALEQQTSAVQEFSFRLRRNTTVLEASVTPRLASNRTAARELFRIDPLATRAGYRTEVLQQADENLTSGVRIVEIHEDSPLPGAGLQVDDILVALNGAPVESAQGFIDRINNEFDLGDEVAVSVWRGDAVLEREFALWDPGRRISRVSLGPLLQYRSSLAPDRTRLTILDLMLFALYRYDQVEGERSHSFLGLFNITSDYGELVEERQ